MRTSLGRTGGVASVPNGKGRFGTRLKELREAAGLTVYALAKRAKLTQINIHRIENGERDPAWATAVKLAEALGVSLSEFDALPPASDQNPESPPTP